MAEHRKISVSLPDSLYFAVNAEFNRTGKSRSAIVAEALRARFEPGETLEQRGPREGISDVPTREEFEEVKELVADLKRLAENQGAL